MAETARMRVREPFEHRAYRIQGLLGAQRAHLLDDTAKRDAVDVLGCQVGVAGLLEGRVDLSDVRMAQAGRDHGILRRASRAQALQADEPVACELTCQIDRCGLGAGAEH